MNIPYMKSRMNYGLRIRNKIMRYMRVNRLRTDMINWLKIIHGLRDKLTTELMCKVGIIIIISSLIIKRRHRSLIIHKNVRFWTDGMQRERPRRSPRWWT